MKTLTKLYFIVILFSILCCCKKKPDANPCQEIKDFSIEDVPDGGTAYWGTLWQKDLTDTIIGENATFTAFADNVQYKWEIGTATYYTKSVTLNFQGIPKSTVIPVKLIVKRKSNDPCFKNDSIDSSVRNLVITNNFPFYGSFHGHYTDNPLDTFTISFANIYDSLTMSNQVFVNNLVKGCGSFWETASEAYKEIAFSMASNECHGIVADAIMDLNNQITINFIYYDPNDPTYKTRITKTFVGKKIY